MKINLSQSLRFRMPLLITLGIMPSAIAAIIWVGQYVNKNLIEPSTKNTLELKAQSLNETTSRWIEMNVLALKNLSQQPATRSLERKAQESVLTEFTRTYQDIYLAHTIGLNGMNIARSDGQVPRNYSDRVYYKGAIAGNDITYQTLISRTNKQPALCMSTPIKQDTVISGVSSICTILNQIAEPVGAIRIGETGYGFVVDNLGQVLAHGDPAFVQGEELTDLSNSPPVKQLLAGNEGYSTFTDQEGIKWVAYGSRLENGWGVIILQEEAEAFAQKRYIQNITVFISALALVAIGGLTWVLANTLIKPIRELTEASLNFAEGKLDSKIETSRQDELGLLSESFNQMAQQIKDSFIAIEERNAELDKLLQEKKASEQEQRLAKEKLQRQVQTLKIQLEPVSQGDLTVQVDVSNDEIGTVASYYNKTIQNLRQIVAEVKNTSEVVAQTTNSSKNAIAQLSQGALQQTEEIITVFNKVQQIVESVQLVAGSAQEAENSIKIATKTVKQGDAALNATVERIVNLGESTTTAKEQVQKLGKASRRIAKAVELIRKIALQTHVLAVNASIEAARAGQEGMGFNVVAEEVQSLAARSAKTAEEIEQLVLEIQTETRKVVKVMENNNQEILAESKSMQKTRASLEQVTNASLEIDRLVTIITQMATEQSQTSETVTANIEQLAAIANNTSASATDVSISFRKLLHVTEKLQESVGQFKIN